MRRWGGERGEGLSPRRPVVNNIDAGISEKPPPDTSKFCPKCNFSLSYLKDLGIWVCKCGWGVPKDLLHNNNHPHPPLPQPRNNNNNKKTTDEEEPVIMGGRNNPHSSVIRSSEEEEENSIPIASKPLRSEELANRVKRLPGEDRDTAMLQEKGYTLTDSCEYQATKGDVDTISSDDLFFDNPTSGVRRRYSKKW